MSRILRELISERGFERFRPGLESRIRANGLAFTVGYFGESHIPTLAIRLEGRDRMGELMVWETGHCNLDGVVVEDGRWSHRHVVLETEGGFHKQLAALFLFVTGQSEITQE